MSYLIYHPTRVRNTFEGIVVYHDHTTGNQDPYVWNRSFLHTFCHITQMRSEEGDINFWVSGGDMFPNFTSLYCDLVFVVKSINFWAKANTIAKDDPLVQSPHSYVDHFRWAECQHRYKRRRRKTLVADPSMSFQPQLADRTLPDVMPILAKCGIAPEELWKGMRAGRNSKPFRIEEDVAKYLHHELDKSPIRLLGERLEGIRERHEELTSSAPRKSREQKECC